MANRISRPSKELIEALGLPERCFSAQLKLSADGAMVVEASYLLDEVKDGELVKALKKYKLVPIEEGDVDD